MTVTGVVVLAHGSRGERGRVGVETALEGVTAGVRALFGPDAEIVGAALQFNRPCLEEAVALLSGKGIVRIVIAPYFLFPGRHITEDIPVLIEKLEREYAGTRFILADALGLDESFAALIARRVRQAAPDLALCPSGSLAECIEQESLEIVESLLPPTPGLCGEELRVVKRVVHACGDPEVACRIRFSQTAMSSGLAAIAAGGPIFTDVRMVMAGIDRRLAGAFGCPVSCALDETGRTGPADGEDTRTAAAMRFLGARLGGAVAAIGNSPTALLALLDLVDRKNIRPALVVGMPVGFVQARESKEELMRRDIPYITVTGTRGGSAMAVAAVNALLRLA